MNQTDSCNMRVKRLSTRNIVIFLIADGMTSILILQDILCGVILFLSTHSLLVVSEICLKFTFKCLYTVSGEETVAENLRES